MTAAYRQLLEATIQHLEGLKAEGERFVGASPELLASLAKPSPRRPKPPSAPSPAVQPSAPPPSPRPAAAKQDLLFGASGGAPASPSAVPSPAAAAPMDPQTQAAAMTDLRARALVCTKCPPLVSARTQVVFGVGDTNADLMFVGEAPGADEDQQGEPFVGLAGQLLTKIISAMGLSRDQVYIANILKCRPDTPGQTSGNRKPTVAEMQTCIPWLHSQIELIQPKVLVALGATAVEGLLGKTIGISKLRGNWKVYRGIPLMPTYHPAYLLRNQAMTEKRKVWEDMLQVMEKLGMPINDKQRNFFLHKK